MNERLLSAETSSRDHFKFRTTGELIQNGARDIVLLTRITEETTMLRYIAGLVGAAAAMVAFRFSLSRDARLFCPIFGLHCRIPDGNDNRRQGNGPLRQEGFVTH